MSDPAARLTAALADRYRIDRELGQGGMATVYLAQDLKHDRKVAIKVFKPELAAAIGAERFLAEIKMLAYAYGASRNPSSEPFTSLEK
jgi:eukaryotic-like serine/threonine-protein kinase